MFFSPAISEEFPLEAINNLVMPEVTRFACNTHILVLAPNKQRKSNSNSKKTEHQTVTNKTEPKIEERNFFNAVRQAKNGTKQH